MASHDPSAVRALFNRPSVPPREVQEASGDTLETCISFVCDGVRVAVRFGMVREVIESTRVIPYPIPVQGHHGITSLRGQVIPVFACPFQAETEAFDGNAPQQLVVLELPGGGRAGLRARDIRRLGLRESEINENAASPVVNVEGKPARLLRAADLGTRKERTA